VDRDCCKVPSRLVLVRSGARLRSAKDSTGYASEETLVHLLGTSTLLDSSWCLETSSTPALRMNLKRAIVQLFELLVDSKRRGAQRPFSSEASKDYARSSKCSFVHKSRSFAV
jgi:hypothetical protein